MKPKIKLNIFKDWPSNIRKRYKTSKIISLKLFNIYKSTTWKLQKIKNSSNIYL